MINSIIIDNFRCFEHLTVKGFNIYLLVFINPLFLLQSMQSIKKLRKAIKANKKLIWKDPDPIKGNDYKITFIEKIKKYFDTDRPIFIQYNKGGSEAYVYLNEIKIKKK